MTLPSSKSPMESLADVLNELRDSWVLISLAIKDHVANTPSAERDQTIEQTTQLLNGVKISDKSSD